MTGPRPAEFKRVLIANRGEIALRSCARAVTPA
jgi:acetyl/propionyl-CoA carboxylase alpha subunit